MRFIFLTILLLVGCTKKESSPCTLRICFNTQPNTTDPCKAADFISSTLVCMLYEGLTRCLPDKDVEPALAKGVDVLENGTLYVFHLREAYWSDGNPITALDFERSWKQIIESAGPCAFLFYPIKNAEPVARGTLPIHAVGIHAIDAKTLLVELERPTPYFYKLTAFPSFLPSPENLSLYSGPFQIEKMTTNDEIVLIKNKNYWNKKSIYLDKIHISIIQDEMTALYLFERGNLDWIGSALSPLPADALERLQHQTQYIATAASTLCTFNTLEFPFGNANMRKAFSFAIDREQIVDQITHKEGIAAVSILPPIFSKQCFFLTDLKRARLHFEQGLQELGIQAKDLSITLYFRSNQTEKRLAQILQKQWKDLLGIDVELLQLDVKTHAQKLQAKDYKIALASWVAQFEDPLSILDRFKYANHLKNYPGWENPRYLELLTQAEHTYISHNEMKMNDQETHFNGVKIREGLLEKAEQLLAEELPLTPIYHSNSAALCNHRIKKIATSYCGGILFERFEMNTNPNK